MQDVLDSLKNLVTMSPMFIDFFFTNITGLFSPKDKLILSLSARKGLVLDFCNAKVSKVVNIWPFSRREKVLILDFLNIGLEKANKTLLKQRQTRRVVIVFLFCLSFSSITITPSFAKLKTLHKKTGSYVVSAKSAIVLSARGKQFYQKNIFRPVQPASTTKVMTAILVLEKLPLDQVLTVKETATWVQPSRLDLKPGEHYRVSDLLYALLINSANDASVVLAEGVAGSEANFVQLMNRRARQLGATRTRFVNAHGLPVKGKTQFTTAYDMAMIFKTALKNSFFRNTIAQRYKIIYSQEGRRITLKNHNRMLFTPWGKDIRGKTGYTRAAQSCFVGYMPQGKDDLLVAVFGCSRRWHDIHYLMMKYGGLRR